MTDPTDDPNEGDRDPENPKTCILLTPGDSHLASQETERVLAATGEYFHSAGTLVRIVNRGDGGIATERVNEQTLKLVLSDRIDWERKRPDGVRIRCDPHHTVIQALLHGQDHPFLPPLNGLARQPFYAPDGRLVGSPGYDVGTGIFGAFNASDYHLDSPSREDAARALEFLDNLLEEFEFETEADRSAALCGMLTAACRPSLAAAPAILISATNPGSGKSYLAELLALIAGPGEPYRVSFPERADESGKLVISVLMEKPAVVLFDDMQTNWKSLGPLNRALSSSATTERLLGSNQTVTVPTRAFFLGTGNQIEPERDARRRVLPIHLAPAHETPALRKFRGNPVGRVRRNRARAVQCAMLVVGAFLNSGDAIENVPAIGTYEEWSRYCRFPLIWLGLPDPAQRLIDQLVHDPERQNLAEFLARWLNRLGGRSFTVRQIIAAAEADSALMEALEELPVMDGRQINRGKLGWFISKNLGRRADGLVIARGDSSERRSWKVIATGNAS